MAAATSLHLLLILLFCAVPISRSRYLLHEMQTQDHGVSKTLQQGITEDTWEEEELTINGKMDLESSTNDYPGPGSNPRHNPRPPLGRN